MLVKKLESLERRLVKTMARDEASKKKWQKPYELIKTALDAANEDNFQEALEAMGKFNALMSEYKLS